MPHFFTDLRSKGAMARDEEGAEFAHLEDALTEANSARDLVRQFMDTRAPLGETCVEVRDGQGRLVAALTAAKVLEIRSTPRSSKTAPSLRPGHR